MSRGIAHPLRSVSVFGVVIALLLAGMLAAMLWSDHANRLQAAQRQSMALAAGSDRLLRAELTAVERVLRRVAEDGRGFYRQYPGRATALLQEGIGGTLGRNPDLAAITLVDDAGAALTAGRGDASLPRWVSLPNRVLAGEMYLGDVERTPDGGTVMMVAMPMQPGQWLLARVRLAVFQRVVSGLDTGRNGVASIGNRQGQLLAHSLDPSAVERALPRPMRKLEPADKVQPMGAVISPLDGVRRISAVSVPRDYPLVLFTGLSAEEVMAPWRTYLYVAIGLFLLYLAGFAYLFHSVRGNARRQARLTDELRAGAAELALAHKVGKVGTWFIEGDGTWVHWSDITRQMFGLELRGTSLEAFLGQVCDEDREHLRKELARAWNGEEALDMTYRFILPDGGLRWLAVRGERVDSQRGRRLAGAVVDVSEHLRNQERAQEAERQFRLVFDRNPAPFWIFDVVTLQFLEVNRAAMEQYGYSREEFLAMTILDIRPEEEWNEVRQARDDALGGRALAPRVRMHRRKDGSTFEVVGHMAQLEFDGRAACLTLAEDVSQRLAYERDLAYRASHDPDTGLLTVRALAEQLDADGGGYTILHIQLRGLRLVTDTLGREAGEDVLQAMVGRLGGLGARHGLTAWQPAEDFVVAVTAGHDPQAALEALLEAASEPVRGRDSFHQLEPRIGVASCPDDGEGADQVLGRAAQAAHAARGQGVVVSRFDCRMAARHAERLQLAGRIRRAIDRDEFELHFQPIRHAADGTPAVLEALLRWPQPDGGFVPPSDFIQLCEDTGLIIVLGRWVIQAAARAQRELAAHGWAGLPIAVNVSAIQLFNSDLLGEFVAATAANGLAPGALQMELTESCLMHNPAQAMQVLKSLNARGIAVSLDDFGTGFSSMSYLQHLPLDSLKIDRCFVTDVERNPRNAAICRALLSLGHSMGLVVIAEGVENQAQLDWLVAHGCDQVQGYLLGQPMPLAEVIAQLALSCDGD
ncbi:Diguanylate cyclaSe/phosphodiesterase with PAS/PAC sensor [uncultured Stenotrophomonas sp.]|uniref:Diguanylate cyclaSe/phosphodiesterase with PAS/PAC sensor n=1 Tax=uncultured Stenotrophomonas sp. TaxID=165438 RepID=A0A1Y5Q6Q9_9GAMM|nr:Diguanylate cyclaSe/phosphodiesterase with PAS/PAC sensor [uncultured Stenotrophomonas sp.]